MNLEAAKALAQRRADIMVEPYVVLGPCPVEGYWVESTRLAADLHSDRAPAFTAFPRV